jgi:hypothetical protein
MRTPGPLSAEDHDVIRIAAEHLDILTDPVQGWRYVQKAWVA